MTQIFRFAFRWSLHKRLRPIPEAVEAFMVERLEWIVFLLRHICERFIFQLDGSREGEFGNFHYQGSLNLKRKTRGMTLCGSTSAGFETLGFLRH